jgi:Biotin-protein ligase, N terminal
MLHALAADIENWQQSYRFVNFLLKEGAKIFWATEPCKAVTSGKGAQIFERGSLLVTDMPSEWLQPAEQRYGVDLLSIESVEGFAGLELKPLRIALYGGGGAPFNHARIFAELGFLVDFISPQEVRQGRLSEFDILVMPGGGGIAMKGQLDPLGDEGCMAIKAFVQRGGMYMGSCAGAFDAAIVSDSFLAVCPMQRHMQLVNSIIWNRNDTEWVGLNSPGVGVLESQNLHPDHPVMFGMPERFRITHYNGPLFEPQPGALADASESIGLSAVVGFTEEFTPAEYFLSIDELDQATAHETALIGKAAREGRFNVVAGYNGMGRVVLFGSHPEFGYNLAMDQWGVPARMLANAAFWQSSNLAEPRTMLRKPVQGTAYSLPLGRGLRFVVDRLGAITDAASSLLQRKSNRASWLGKDLAMSTFGLSGQEIWVRNLAAFDDIAKELRQTIQQAEAAAEEAGSLGAALRTIGKNEAVGLSEALHDALLGLEEAVHYRTPNEWNQDFGYEGLLQMLDRTEAMLHKADANFAKSFERSANPYQHFDSSPFQLAVGSYLAAVGVFENAWFLLKIHFLRLEELVFKARSTLKDANYMGRSDRIG